ncbi:MAG: phosphopentomutase, partial [Clostridiales Family XIII bacterium]|nr:phosphopentomutase [Clostridiales Family XIII bacterium]
MFRRVTLIVMDSLGVGALPDAVAYGDAGANTLGHIVTAYPKLNAPNLTKLGLFNIDGLELLGRKVNHTVGAYGRLAEASKGKDTITGHWEIAGLLTEIPFQTFETFPEDFMRAFEQRIGVGTLGNYAASGTEIIEILGPAHESTGKPIIYTSNDSVFQIAVNTSVISLARLYEICEIAREMLQGPMLVGRVIARPYEIRDGKRVRTSDRRDYAVSPPLPTLLDNVIAAGLDVISIGKIHDIFAGHGTGTSIHTEDNDDGCRKTIEAMRGDTSGLIFTNLVDFDSKYGHRRNPEGYAHAIESFDQFLPEIFAAMRNDEILMLCADHGNDPV